MIPFSTYSTESLADRISALTAALEQALTANDWGQIDVLTAQIPALINPTTIATTRSDQLLHTHCVNALQTLRTTHQKVLDAAQVHRQQIADALQELRANRQAIDTYLAVLKASWPKQ